MVISQGTGDWAQWWLVKDATKPVLNYIQHTVPQLYRVYAPEKLGWWVHTKYIANVRKLEDSTQVTDPWSVLYLRKGAPMYIVDAVWKALAKRLHPDAGGDAEAFRMVKEAYDTVRKDDN